MGQSYLIVGAGVFGISTAYHLIQKYPSASITVVDRDAFDADSRVAASWDWNKVVRADYDDFLYCRMGLEAQDVFEKDPLWQPYFHSTGLYWMCGRKHSQGVIDNFTRLGRAGDLQAVSVEQARKMYGGLFDEADYQHVDGVLINKKSGWAAAGDCLQAVTRKCIELGVKYVVADIASLTFGSNRQCTGIQDTDGKRITADKVILCTGAFTPTLLDWSAASSGNADLRAGDRILAGGITTGMTQLNDEAYKKYADMPVGMQGYTAKPGPFMGTLPPTKDRELKWWGDVIFKNTRETSHGSLISSPPALKDYGQWDVSRQLQEGIRYVSSVFYGKQETSGWKMSKHRICWDAFTTSSDFIISAHPASDGLFIATCGSFHGFKFFPVIGKYVIQMLEGDLEPEAAGKWAWDRDRPDPALNPEYPTAEMRQLLDPVRPAKL